MIQETKSKSQFSVERERDFLLGPPEVSVFLACRTTVNELRCLASGFESGEMRLAVFLQQSALVIGRLNELAAATERFDIVFPVKGYGQLSPFFWRWFNWWNDHLNALTPRQLSHLERQAREGLPAVNLHRPKDDWVRYSHTPAFVLVDLDGIKAVNGRY